jgi:hypothetical protein
VCIRETECVPKVVIIVIAWILDLGNITLSRNQNIAVKFHSPRSKIAIIMVSVVLIIRDVKKYTLPILFLGGF